MPESSIMAKRKLRMHVRSVEWLLEDFIVDFIALFFVSVLKKFFQNFYCSLIPLSIALETSTWKN